MYTKFFENFFEKVSPPRKKILATPMLQGIRGRVEKINLAMATEYRMLIMKKL